MKISGTHRYARRLEAGEPSLACFTNKTAALVSASTGALGGIRGLPIVRMILSNIGVVVLPDQLAISKADAAFDEAGALVEATHQDRLGKLGARLVDVTRRLNT